MISNVEVDHHRALPSEATPLLLSSKSQRMSHHVVQEGESSAIEVLDHYLHRQLSLDTMSSDDVEVDGSVFDEPSASQVDSVVDSMVEVSDTKKTVDMDLSLNRENGVAGTSPLRSNEDPVHGDNDFHENGVQSHAEHLDIERNGNGAVTTSTPPEKPFHNDEDEEAILQSMTTNICTNWNWLHILYLSLFTTIGVTMRAFIGRFFGGDCSSYDEGHVINDFLWPLSHKICVTTNGETDQYGGALFIDLPANMIGSFIMGLVTGHSADWPAIAILSHDHPLQEATGLHVGIRTALCGSLTTFSSWNSQMVLMMDGSGTILGSQVLAALFGYIIGLQAALVSYRAGRTLAAWLHLRKNPHIFDSAVSKRDLSRRWYHNHLSWMAPVTILIIILSIILLYLLGDFYWGIPYYRVLWIACLAAPIGTITRWKLSTMNGKFGIRGVYWFPTGTFLANFLGSILSAGLTAWSIVETKQTGGERWEIPAIKAASLGIAGSLSTVSTFAKEIVEIGEKHPHFDSKGFVYSHGTMIICCLVGLLVYSPLVRFA